MKESFTGVIRERGYQTQSERLCIPDHISMQEVCSSLPMHGLLPLFMKRREDMYLLSRIDDKLDVPYLAWHHTFQTLTCHQYTAGLSESFEVDG